MTSPHVSVIVPIYNTMPYLTQTLTSVAEQTIGLDKLQVIAVDDGSTDGSGEEADRFVQRHGDAFVVIHQSNSGGPAGPCNRGLEVATGRYVFFLGADDYLGLEAMQRLVEAADAWGSDVVLGRIEGVNGRYVDQTIFEDTQPDLDLYDSYLPFAISNTKLFRRELIEAHKIRFPETLPIGSDQPFTIEAMVRATRISVLSDYTYAYGVRRHDASNISYATTSLKRLTSIRTVMHHVADLLPEGAQRDAILRRHFSWELEKLLRRDFLHLDSATQTAVVEGLGELVEAYLTDRIAAQLTFGARLRMRYAQTRRLPLLRQIIEHPERPNLVLDGERYFFPYPGFRDEHLLPDDWFDARGEETRSRVTKGFHTHRFRLSGTTLTIEGEISLQSDSAANLRVVLEEVEHGANIHRTRRLDTHAWSDGSPVLLNAQGPNVPSEFTTEVDLTEVLASDADPETRWSVRLRVLVGDQVYDLPFEAVGERQKGRVRFSGRRFRVTAGYRKRDLLYVKRTQIDS